jgi:hypothetical protein
MAEGMRGAVPLTATFFGVPACDDIEELGGSA